MMEDMIHHNFLFVKDYIDADIIIVNTCTVTNTADTKCLKMIRRIKRECPNSILVVCGCSVQNDQTKYQDLGINILLGNRYKSSIAELINKYLEDKNDLVQIVKTRKLDFENMAINNFNHVRAFIKIEDGCDNFCSYCVIPFVRGSVRSKDFNEVINEAKNLVLNNHKEIVLTGIHTGAYESNGHDLADLINELAKIDGLMRIRISSIEATELNENFLNTLKNNKKLVDHLHIPLQAGSDEILKLMNRKYDLAYFINKINEIRSIRPDISISTDVIVGHPYETDELFNKTLETVKKINFSKVHVFPYSKRNGTKAASMDNQVDECTKKKRVVELIKLSDALEEKYYQKFVGKTIDVLIEECHNNIAIGHTSNYLKVTLNEDLKVGSIVNRVL